MKKYLLTSFLCLVLIFCVCSLAMAMPEVDRDIRIYDFAELLTEGEILKLSEKAARLSEERSVDLVCVFTDDSLGYSPEEYSRQFWSLNIFGYGDRYDGIMLYVNMTDRDIYVLTDGRATDHLGSSDIDALLDVAAEGLTGGAASPAYVAADRFLESAAGIVDRYAGGSAYPEKVYPEGYPEDVYPTPDYQTVRYDEELAVKAGGSALIGVLVALTVVLIMKYCHNAKLVTPFCASGYLKGPVSPYRVIDTFVSTHTVKTAIPKDNDSGGSSFGGGGSGRSSGGGSHSFGGGGRSF